MLTEKFALQDWHMPFMLLELSSYAQNKELGARQQQDCGLITEMHNFFHTDQGNEAMDIFWNHLEIDDDTIL